MGLLEIARDFAVANWDNAIMWVIGGILIYLAIKKDMEPTLLLPMGFGAIIVNLPGSAIAADGGIIRILYDCGIANEFFPLVLFIGIGAMIDFGPLLSNFAERREPLFRRLAASGPRPGDLGGESDS